MAVEKVPCSVKTSSGRVRVSFVMNVGKTPTCLIRVRILIMLAGSTYS
jgi:hypothetical protein